jgi:hypothetical protein
VSDRSLAGLVREAAERCRGDVAERAAEIVRLAEIGMFGAALEMTRFPGEPELFWASVRGMAVEYLWDLFRDHYEIFISAIKAEPCWQGLSEVCELADRIDQFLAVYDGSGEGAGLARSCRDDVGLLGVLADWLTDHQYLSAAEEARHLGRLFESVSLTLPMPQRISYQYLIQDLYEQDAFEPENE